MVTFFLSNCNAFNLLLFLPAQARASDTMLNRSFKSGMLVLFMILTSVNLLPSKMTLLWACYVWSLLVLNLNNWNGEETLSWTAANNVPITNTQKAELQNAPTSESLWRSKRVRIMPSPSIVYHVKALNFPEQV